MKYRILHAHTIHELERAINDELLCRYDLYSTVRRLGHWTLVGGIAVTTDNDGGHTFWQALVFISDDESR